MFAFLKRWRKARLESRIDEEDLLHGFDTARRIDPRHDCTKDVRLLEGNEEYWFKMRDLSRTGASGVSDAPLASGQIVRLELDPVSYYEAEVRWNRKASMGLAFTEPLSQNYVERLRNRYRQRPAGNDGKRRASA